jgi:hypothetical protein
MPLKSPFFALTGTAMDAKKGVTIGVTKFVTFQTGRFFAQISPAQTCFIFPPGVLFWYVCGAGLPL